MSIVSPIQFWNNPMPKRWFSPWATGQNLFATLSGSFLPGVVSDKHARLQSKGLSEEAAYIIPSGLASSLLRTYERSLQQLQIFCLSVC